MGFSGGTHGAGISGGKFQYQALVTPVTRAWGSANGVACLAGKGQ
jgi:hypothetical protein